MELIVNISVIIFFLFLAAMFLYGILPLLFTGAIFLPTDKETVKRMVKLAGIKPGERACDLGSGDGRLVIALAEAGAEAHGYEINPYLVLLANRKIHKAALTDKAFVHWKSFWQEDLSRFNIVTVFGISNIMDKLEKKLKKEIKISGRVVSNSFTFLNWPADKKEGNVYLYVK